ncbi:crossover junction endonuclease MUS81 isoform X6 [Manis javanica]|uniref:crossover junction endonuclease MUS81 isoform X6 n=1 Tax=Manis javanica TaxID=9974 RepID=UPI00187AB982|nr:crossover junction endonuclease MUS81 isoform X6 [Manis javanica]
MAAPVRLGRKRPLPVCPNPLFVRWLSEWRDEAASRGRRTQFVFQKALRSLRRYPLPLRSGKEAKILRHFGDGLCRMLDERLQQHQASGGDHVDPPPGAKSPAPGGPPAGVPDSSMPSPSGHSFLTKEELLQRCTQKAPKRRQQREYSAASTGAGAWRVQGAVVCGRWRDQGVSEVGHCEGEEVEGWHWPALTGLPPCNSRAGHRSELLRQLQRLHVTHMVRKLHVGDFVWVAQETCPRNPARPGELVLDHIVERKRLDDLCSSIIDGRFREQKFRLKRCGLGHRVYLVEEYGSVHKLSLPESTLLQAVTNTQVIDGFFVKRTADIKESAAYLALLTRGLQRFYQGRALCSRPWGTPGDAESGSRPSPDPVCSLLTFNDFNSGAIKNKAQSVQEVFARQLMQVCGVSGEKAAALVDRFSTPASLLAAYDSCGTPKEQEMMLSTIKCGQLQRNLGPALSRTLSQLYCSPGPLT